MKQLSILLSILFVCVSLCACDVGYGEGHHIKVKGDEMPVTSDGGIVVLKCKPSGFLNEVIKVYRANSRADETHNREREYWEGELQRTEDGHVKIIVPSPDGKELVVAEPSSDYKTWTVVIPPNTSAEGRCFHMDLGMMNDWGGATVYQEGTKP